MLNRKKMYNGYMRRCAKYIREDYLYFFEHFVKTDLVNNKGKEVALFVDVVERIQEGRTPESMSKYIRAAKLKDFELHRLFYKLGLLLTNGELIVEQIKYFY